jgi:hypothetical protein
VARILGAVSSVTGQGPRTLSEEQEREVDAVKPLLFVRSCWLCWCCDGCFFLCEAGVRGLTVVCERGSRLFTLWRRSSSGHSGLQRPVVWRSTAVASSAQFLMPFLWLLSQDEVVQSYVGCVICVRRSGGVRFDS